MKRKELVELLKGRGFLPKQLTKKQLQRENENLRKLIRKMKNCHNCGYFDENCEFCNNPKCSGGYVCGGSFWKLKGLKHAT